MLKKQALLIFIMTCMLAFTGCGEREELTVFNEQINDFYTEISALETEIASMDAETEDAVAVLLTHLQEMGTKFQQLAEAEVPVEFISVEDLAEDAASYMQEAVRLYEAAYEEESVNDALIQAAAENYEYAMKRVNYIAIILQGEIPEGATVIETDGTEFEPYTED